jgi:hypothetical protein
VSVVQKSDATKAEREVLDWRERKSDVKESVPVKRIV